jgi:hypothetical protein
MQADPHFSVVVLELLQPPLAGNLLLKFENFR